MKKNAFINILFNWNKFAQNQKLQALQALENEQSKIQRRPARKIKMCRDEEVIKMLAEQNVTASAYVDDSKKDSIFILNLNCSAVKMIETIFFRFSCNYLKDLLLLLFLLQRLKVHLHIPLQECQLFLQ